MKKLQASVALVSLLLGCSSVAALRARDEAAASKAIYKSCLQEHPDNPAKCESFRRIYEADLLYYTKITNKQLWWN